MRRRDFMRSGIISVASTIPLSAPLGNSMEPPHVPETSAERPEAIALPPPVAAQDSREIPFRQQTIDLGYVPAQGETRMENGLWEECPKERQFTKGGKAIIALRMTVVGKGQIGEAFAKPGSEMEFTSVAYWYQREPHQPFGPMLPARDRAPFEPPPSPEKLAADRKHLDAGEALVLKCGGDSEIEFMKPGWAASKGYITHPGYVITRHQMTSEIEFLKPGWDFRLIDGRPANDSIARIEGWPSGSWRSIEGQLKVHLLCPKRTTGTLKLFLLDGDKAGRKQTIVVANRLIGELANFEAGKWVEVPISAADTADGVIPIDIKPTAGPDAALSKIVLLEA
jgi:hypothetical protein